jgi:hypothetical protein
MKADTVMVSEKVLLLVKKQQQENRLFLFFQ